MTHFVCVYGHMHAVLHTLHLVPSNCELVTVLRGSISACLMQELVHYRNHLYSSFLRGKFGLWSTMVQDTIYFVLASRTGWVIP